MTLPVETLKSVPPGKAVWNANGGFVSVLLTHLFSFYSTLSIVLYGAVEHWMSGALVSLGDMIYDMIW